MNRAFAQAVLHAVNEYGVDEFRIHPKGTGVVCIRPEGILPHVLVADYLGELYPSYRWCERIDVVQQAQQTYEIKPVLPDFYNILLERPKHDPAGYSTHRLIVSFRLICLFSVLFTSFDSGW